MEKSLFLKKIQNYIAGQQLCCPNDRILVALSGGADSVTLLHTLICLGYNCIAAHCNFHLRGEESRRDENFCRQLCFRLGIQLYVKDFDVASYMSKFGVSLEMACRELRYEWFHNLAKENNCQVIAVAHHQDDKTETFFINAFRGCGINGLASIKPRNEIIVRPLLCVTRREIEEYIESLDEQFVIDSTNLQSDVQRNKIRNIILPIIRQEIPQEQLSTTIDNLNKCNKFYQGAIRKAISDISEVEGDNTILNLPNLKSYDGWETLLWEALKPYGFTPSSIEDLSKCLTKKNKTGKCFYSDSNVAVINRDKIIVSPKFYTSDECIVVDWENIDNLPICLELKKIENINDIEFTSNLSYAYFDISILSHKTVIRHWKAGDKMRQFGMKGCKKLSDIFNDAKISTERKHRLWIFETDNKIVWIPGIKNSAEFTCSPNSEIIQLKLTDKN